MTVPVRELGDLRTTFRLCQTCVMGEEVAVVVGGGNLAVHHSIIELTSQTPTMQTGLLQGHGRTMSACHYMDRMRTWQREQREEGAFLSWQVGALWCTLRQREDKTKTTPGEC